MAPAPVLPDYSAGCLSNLLHAITSSDPPEWYPNIARGAAATVLLVVDGLGWNQLMDRKHLTPTLAAMEGGPIHSVAPTTTATALTSITTGLVPAEHGIIGYRILIDGGVLNVLRWSIDGQDMRAAVPAEEMQSVVPFMGLRPPVVTKVEFDRTGFSQAHLRTARLVGWRSPSSLGVEIARQRASGENLIYGYYDGVDKISHAEGLGEHFDAEVAFADVIVGSVLDAVPEDVVVLVTADHGQVHVGERTTSLPADVRSLVSVQSGEGRFRWLHARPGAADELLAECTRRYAHESWVVSRQQTIDEGWFGPRPTSALQRLGDVALVPFEPMAYTEPADTGPYQLIGRHGSLTGDEMLVPLLGGRGRR